MLADDALNSRQPDSGAFKFFSSMKPLKRSEELARMFCVESGTVVPNIDHGFAVDRHLIDLDHSVLSAPSVFDGIGQKVRESLLQQPWVAIDGGQRTNMPIDLSPIESI